MSNRNDIHQQPTRPGRRPFDEQTTETVPLAPSTVVPQAPYIPYSPGAQMTPPAMPTNTPRRRGVSRRTFLIGATAGAVGVGAVAAGAGYALTRYFDPLSRANVYTSEAGQINHLLRRAGFGPSPSDIGEYLSLGVSGAIDRLVNVGGVSNDALDTLLNSRNFTFAKREELGQWWLLRMLYTHRPLEEKMTLFWHGLLTSSFTKIGGKRGLPLLIQQNQLFRSKGLGRFDDLIKAVTADPAMLRWLDGGVSTGRNPNENYARELMELFTMGIGNYTQNDVHQGALIFTGWAIRDGQGTFVPQRHYDGTVTFLGHTGNLSSDDAIKIICAHPATGPHLAGHLWTFFVHDQPSSSDLKPLVDAYYSQNHSIAAMMKALLTSPAFFGAQAYRARVKSPAEFVVGAMRGLAVPPLQNQALNFLNAAMIQMGQTLFDPPNVAGWDGDKVSGAWMSTQAWLTRVNFINTLMSAASGIPLQATGDGGRRAGAANANPQGSLLQHLLTSQQLRTAQDVARYFTAALLDGQISSDREALLTQTLEQHDNGPGFTLTGGVKLPASALRNMLYLLHSLPEYQMN